MKYDINIFKKISLVGLLLVIAGCSTASRLKLNDEGFIIKYGYTPTSNYTATAISVIGIESPHIVNKFTHKVAGKVLRNKETYTALQYSAEKNFILIDKNGTPHNEIYIEVPNGMHLFLDVKFNPKNIRFIKTSF